MTYHKFEIFLDLAESGSMSETARRFYISPSSVSQTISSLEQNYHTVLFERQGKRLTLTSAGQILSSYARQIVALYQEAEARLSRSSIRMIRVGSSLSVSSVFTSPAIFQFRQNPLNTGIEISLTIDNHNKIIRQLSNYELDIAVVSLSSYEQPRLTVYPLFPDPVRLCCSSQHPLASRSRVTFSDLADQNITLLPPNSSLRTRFEQCAKKEGVLLRNILTSNNQQSIKDLVLHNQTISRLPSILIRDEVKNGLLSVLDVDGFSYIKQFALVHRNDRELSEEEARFVKICLDLAAGKSA